MRHQDITLQSLLKTAGIKQRELADLLGLSESSISLKLSGKREMTLEEAGLIAGLLKTTEGQIRHALNFAKCKVDMRTTTQPNDAA